MENNDIWGTVLGNDTLIIIGIGLGLVLLSVLGSMFLRALREDKDFRDATGKDD